MNTPANPAALVTTDWLQEHIGDPAVAIVEVDEDTSTYAAGHIAGAVSLDWKTELHDLPRRDFVDARRLADLLGSKGISDEMTIVLYGGNNNWFAAYAYWLCRYRGIGNVTLLDGGRIKWEREERLTTPITMVHEPATLTPKVPRPELRAFRNEVETAAHTGTSRLIDVRSPAEFTGEIMAPPHLPQEQPYVPGHIPGAVNIPWAVAANDDGTFKSVAELSAIYEAAGVRPDDDVVAYCRIGERSSHTWFVLHELLGFPNVSNYDGSWTEYGSLVGVPVKADLAA